MGFGHGVMATPRGQSARRQTYVQVSTSEAVMDKYCRRHCHMLLPVREINLKACIPMMWMQIIQPYWV